jgi:excinuclease UvrABC nuclease subunit
VQSYLDTGGQSLVREFEHQRDDASANLDFEAAAALHARLEKLKPVLGQLPEIVHSLDALHAVVVQPSTVKDSVAFFRVDAGRMAGPATFSIQSPEHAKSQSMESRVQRALNALPPGNAHSSLEAMEHLAILKRWYNRGTRVGEIFFAEDSGELPMRRIVRGISRVSRGEKPEAGIPMPST